MDYKNLLIDNFELSSCSSKESFVVSDLFGVFTYDEDIDKIIANRFLDICDAISNKKTFEYIDQNHDQYLFFALCMNFDFFKKNTEYGTSIRGCWWRDIEIESFNPIETENYSVEYLPLKIEAVHASEFFEAVRRFVLD